MAMIVLSLALSAVAALFELLLLALRNQGVGFAFSGPIAIWMVPLSYACFMLPLGAVAGVASRWGERWRHAATVTLTAVAFFSATFLFHPKVHLIAIAVLSLGCGIQIARYVATRQRATARAARIGALTLGAWIVIGAIGERALSSRSVDAPINAATAETQPNVVLLILDTVRAASLSLYGHDRATTPNLDALARRAAVFDQAISPSPWTLPSHASIFTGTAPYAMSVDWEHPLPDSGATLAERFRAAGYRTGGFVANVAYTSAETGLSRGFAHYEDYVPHWSGLITSSSLGRFFSNNPRLRQILGYYDILGRKTAAQLNARALRWVREDSTRPFFLFVNYYDAHEPYLPAAPFDTLFGSSAGRDLTHIRQLSAHIAGRAHKFSMTPAERDLELLAYEQSITWLDSELGKLFDALGVRDSSAGRQTLVVVTSDHGEQFLENGLFGHGNGLYMPSLHVPLLIAGPNVPSPGSRRTDVVSTSDIGATVLALAGVTDASGFGGRSLFGGPASDLAVSSIRPARNQDSDYPSFRGKMYSATTPSMHVIRNADGTLEQFGRGPATAADSAAERLRALSAIDAARSNEYSPGGRGSVPKN